MAVLPVAVEEPIDLHLSVEQDEKVILICFVQPTFAAAELDVLLEEQLFVLPLEVAGNGLLLQKRLVYEEQEFFLKSKE